MSAGALNWLTRHSIGFILIIHSSLNPNQGMVACLGIIAWSGDLMGSLMKGAAEFPTVLGMAAWIYLLRRWRRVSMLEGLALRVLAMSVLNLIMLPNYYRMRLSISVRLLPIVRVFKDMQGGITFLLGFCLYETYNRRVQPRQTIQQVL